MHPNLRIIRLKKADKLTEGTYFSKPKYQQKKEKKPLLQSIYHKKHPLMASFKKNNAVFYPKHCIVFGKRVRCFTLDIAFFLAKSNYFHSKISFSSIKKRVLHLLETGN